MSTRLRQHILRANGLYLIVASVVGSSPWTFPAFSSDEDRRATS